MGAKKRGAVRPRESNREALRLGDEGLKTLRFRRCARKLGAIISTNAAATLIQVKQGEILAA